MAMEELVKRAKNSDKNAMEEIINKLKPFVNKLSYSTFIRGYDLEDLKQIGYISIINAVNKFNFSKSDNFLSYAMMAIRNNYFYEIRKRAKENINVSFDQTFDNGVDLTDILASDYNMEEELLHNIDLDKLSSSLNLLLPEERKLISFIFKNGCGAIRKYAQLNNIKYQTCAKRKFSIIKKLQKSIDD